MPKQPDDCAAILALLEPYLDGELPPAEAERLREHAARCPACAAELRLARALQGGLRELPELDAPPAVLARVRAATTEMPVLPFARPSREPAPRSWQPRFAALAAALVLALLGTFLLFEPRSPRPPQPTAAEVAQATAEARYALAYVGRASRRAGLEIKDEVLPEHLLAPSARSLSRSLQGRPGLEPDSAPRQGS